MADNAASSVVEHTGSSNGVKPLADGRFELSRFPILDECTFFNRKKGEWVKLSKDRLHKIADQINHQHKSVGTAIAIIPGHTKDNIPEEDQPPVIGDGVDARVENLINPTTGLPTGRSAIYVTPIAKNSKAVATFAKLNRGRSVELWLNPDDVTAIALLGATAPRRDLGPHLFSQMGPLRFSRTIHDGQEPIYFSISDEDDKMDLDDNAAKPPKSEPKKPDEEAGEGVDPKLVDALFAKMMQSDVWKKLEAIVSAAPPPEAGAPGAQVPPGGPAAAGAPGAAGAGGDDLLAPEDYDDIFADDQGHDAGAAAAAPHHAEKEKPTHLAESEQTRMARENDMHAEADRIRLARNEQEIAELKESNLMLRQKDLLNQVKDELRVIEKEGIVFNFDRELSKLCRLGRTDERRNYYEDMRLNYKRKEDALPNDGNLPVHPDEQAAIHLSRDPDQMTGEEAYSLAQETARRIYEDGEKTSLDKVRMERRERATSANGTKKVS